MEKLSVIDANVEAALPSPDNDEQSFNYAGVIASVDGSISKCTVSGQATAGTVTTTLPGTGGLERCRPDKRAITRPRSQLSGQHRRRDCGRKLWYD